MSESLETRVSSSPYHKLIRLLVNPTWYKLPSMHLQHHDDEYAVRDPADLPTVRQAPGGTWIAEDTHGRSAHGSTPAAAIATLRK